MDATLWRMRNRPETEDPDTGETSPATDAELLNLGIKVVGTTPNGDEIVQAAPTEEEGDLLSPPDFTNLLKPGWTWDDVPDALRDHLLEAAYEEDVDGESVRRRAKIADVPSGATALETDLPPHYWFGDR